MLLEESLKLLQSQRKSRLLTCQSIAEQTCVNARSGFKHFAVAPGHGACEFKGKRFVRKSAKNGKMRDWQAFRDGLWFSYCERHSAH